MVDSKKAVVVVTSKAKIRRVSQVMETGRSSRKIYSRVARTGDCNMLAHRMFQQQQDVTLWYHSSSHWATESETDCDTTLSNE